MFVFWLSLIPFLIKATPVPQEGAVPVTIAKETFVVGSLPDAPFCPPSFAGLIPIIPESAKKLFFWYFPVAPGGADSELVLVSLK